MLREKSQVTLDLEAVERAAASSDLALSAAAIALNNAFNAFWDLPAPRLIALFNEFGPSGIAGVFTKHATAAAALNAALDAAESTGVRAIASVKFPVLGFDPANETEPEAGGFIRLASGIFEWVPPVEVPPIEDEPTEP